MKTLPLLLLTSVVTAVAVVAIYDGIRRAPDPTAPDTHLQAPDFEKIEARLAKLEARERPMLRADGTHPQILERLRAAEARIEQMEEALRSVQPGIHAVLEDAPPTEAQSDDAPPAASSHPSAEDVERFRKLQQAARKAERTKKSRRRVQALLKALEIELSDEQQAQLVEAHTAFGPRRDEVWTQAKMQGAEQGDAVDWPRIISDTTATLQREFTTQISGFLDGADAERIAAGLEGK